MTGNREAALEFLRRFCAGDVEGLHPLLDEDLQFKGPFHSFTSRDGYLDSLRSDPPEKCGFRVLSLTENEDSVAIFYDYQKVDSTLTIAQLCRFRGEKISEILLVLDGRNFA